MESSNKISFLTNQGNQVGGFKGLLDKAFSSLATSVITVGVVVGCVYLGYEGIKIIPSQVKAYQLKGLDFYSAIGGKTIQSRMVGIYYDAPYSKIVQKVEFAGSEESFYVANPKITYKDFSAEKIKERSALLIETYAEAGFLEIEVTTYENKATGEKVNMIISLKKIPPIEVKMDMDDHQTVFYHPKTFESISKIDYEIIMEEMKKEQDFKDTVNHLLQVKPTVISKYAQRFMENGFIEEYKITESEVAPIKSSNIISESLSIENATSVAVEPINHATESLNQLSSLAPVVDVEEEDKIKQTQLREEIIVAGKLRALETFIEFKTLPILQRDLPEQVNSENVSTVKSEEEKLFDKELIKFNHINMFNNGTKPFLPLVPLVKVLPVDVKEVPVLISDVVATEVQSVSSEQIPLVSVEPKIVNSEIDVISDSSVNLKENSEGTNSSNMNLTPSIKIINLDENKKPIISSQEIPLKGVEQKDFKNNSSSLIDDSLENLNSSSKKSKRDKTLNVKPHKSLENIQENNLDTTNDLLNMLSSLKPGQSLNLRTHREEFSDGIVESVKKSSPIKKNAKVKRSS